MATGQTLEGSVIVDDHFSFFEDIREQSMLITSTPFKQSNLLKIDEELVWKGPYESLKLFVKSDLGIDGQWKSTGGEVKKFTSKSYTLKWYGKTKQKLVVIQDDENESLQEKLVKSATLGNFKGHDVGQRSETIGNKNMLEGVQKSTSLSNDDKNNFLDIRKAFDSIDHNILLHKLKDQFGISDIELRWFESYLNNREQVCIVNNSMSSSKRIVSGVPQGSILGPLLFLLYINDLPECLQKTTPYLYADDTQICCSSNSLIELTENLNHDLSRIGDWLSRNKLQHHPTKTKIMFIGSKHHINSTTFDHPVMLNNQRIPRVHSFTCLGLDLDENLNWNPHIQAICKKVGAGLGTLRRIKPFVPITTLQTIYRALIQPYFDYCSPIWGVCDQKLKDKLQKFQNRAARIIVGASYEIRSADVLQSLAWDNLETRRRTTKAILMFKVLKDYIGPTLKESLIRRNHMQTNYDLRNSHTDLALPKPKREFLKKSFKYSGAKLWNSLSIDTKLAESMHLFKSHLKLNSNTIYI